MSSSERSQSSRPRTSRSSTLPSRSPSPPIRPARGVRTPPPREAPLAAHGGPDLAALPDAVDLARLVIVVDEFAGLAEELPAFLSGLVGIAQRGRSLGVHLVLATQRPGGVVSPEIRANCSLRICLRTIDEAESRDVLGSAHAAALPVDVPGRGYLRAGGGVPVP